MKDKVTESFARNHCVYILTFKPTDLLLKPAFLDPVFLSHLLMKQHTSKHPAVSDAGVFTKNCKELHLIGIFCIMYQ